MERSTSSPTARWAGFRPVRRGRPRGGPGPAANSATRRRRGDVRRGWRQREETLQWIFMGEGLAQLRLGRLAVREWWTISTARRYEVDYKATWRGPRRYAEVVAA